MTVSKTPETIRAMVVRRCIAEVALVRAEGPKPSISPSFLAERSYEAGFDDGCAMIDLALRKLMGDR
jgi:hypothetical protein